MIVKLTENFNASQNDYKVVPSYKGSYPDTMNAGIAAFRAGNAPHIMQVFEVGTATVMAATGAVKPVHVLKGDRREVRPERVSPNHHRLLLDMEGRDALVSSSSTVMWINRDALKKAGITEIPKTWPQVFEAAKKLKASGAATCGFSAWPCSG